MSAKRNRPRAPNVPAKISPPPPQTPTADGASPEGSSTGFFIQFRAALLAASGALWAFGYLSQINPQLFTYMNAGDFINAAVIFLPFSIVLMLIGFIPLLFGNPVRERVAFLRGMWRKKSGEWSKSFRGMLTFVTYGSLLTLAFNLVVASRLGAPIQPIASVLSAMWASAVLNEVYAYISERFGWNIKWAGQIIFALYYLSTSFFLGYAYSWAHSQMKHFRTVIYFNDGSAKCVFTFQSLGDSILYFEPKDSAWSMARSSDVKLMRELGGLHSASDASCAEKASAPPKGDSVLLAPDPTPQPPAVSLPPVTLQESAPPVEPN